MHPRSELNRRGGNLGAIEHGTANRSMQVLADIIVGDELVDDGKTKGVQHLTDSCLKPLRLAAPEAVSAPLPEKHRVPEGKWHGPKPRVVKIEKTGWLRLNNGIKEALVRLL
jgi:hypothetical protein